MKYQQSWEFIVRQDMAVERDSTNAVIVVEELQYFKRMKKLERCKSCLLFYLTHMPSF